MRKLPSRESFTDADTESLYRNGYWDEEKIVGAWMEGRLIDREAMTLQDCQDPWECCIHDAPLGEDR